MVGRSLTASTEGIKRAKQALQRKSLTQKAIAIEEGIASRATISKFFTGKPVDRWIFQEICRFLDLEWTDIVIHADLADIDIVQNPVSDSLNPVGSGATPSTSTDLVELLEAVNKRGAIARDALTPRILERIPRSVVREKYLPAIARGVDLEKPRLIPILGPAGHGKSTILSDIYDELTTGDTPWTGLILCSTLSLPDASEDLNTVLAVELGNAMCGQSRSIVDIADDLTHHGRGVILIDTLDLIISRPIVKAFAQLMRNLVELGVTVVFTCRDREYADYLQPSNKYLPGLSHALDSYAVPNFSTAETRLAAETFFRQQSSNIDIQTRKGATFADNILNLSADNRSLRDILENPLLLALLCDLFAAEGNVPPDLTVSKLYQRYWQEKVAHTRSDRRDAQRLAMAKERLCLAIAQRLFELSQERLCESLYMDEIEIEFTDIDLDAYDDLLSEGVLALFPSGRIHFFHQTLLEYAIAYYLTRHSAQSQRQQLFADVNQSNLNQTIDQAEAARNRTYWFPVLRQLLTIVDTDVEFDAWVAQLNNQDLGIFSTVCFAATSRDSPTVLRQLLPTALDLGEAYQKPLRQAFTVASRQLISPLWNDLLLLLETGPHTTAGNTAQIVGEMTARWWSSFRHRLIDAVEALATRHAEHNNTHQPSISYSPGHFREGEIPLMIGWLLQHCFEQIEADGDPALLIGLHPYLPHYGAVTYATVIQLHTVVAVPMEIQWALCRALMDHPVVDDDRVGRAMADWLAYLVERANVELLRSAGHSSVPLDYESQVQAWTRTPLELSWLELLHYPLLERWDKVQGNGIGRWAAKDLSRLAPLVFDLMYGHEDRLNQTLHALKISVQTDASALILTSLQAIPAQPTAMAMRNAHALGQLLNQCVGYLSVEQQETLVQWLSPLLDDYIEPFHIVMNALADQSETALTLLRQHLPKCSPAKQHLLGYRLLRFEPVETHPPLDTLDKAAQAFLVRTYQKQAQSQESNIPYAELNRRLLQAAHGGMKNIAVAATNNMAMVFGDRLTFSQVVPLMRSPYPGVRANALEATIELIKHEKFPSAQDIDEMCDALLKEKDQNIIRLLFSVINAWARNRQPMSDMIFQALSDLPPRLIKISKFEGGVARALLDALKAIAQVSTLDDPTSLLQCTEYLLTNIDVSRMRNGEAETIVLMCAIHRLDPIFVFDFIHRQGAILADRRWHWTLSALFKTVDLVDGKQSDIFNAVLSAEWCTPEIGHLILEVQT